MTLDVSTREVYRGERRLQLTRTEFNLLELFMRNPRQVLTRSQIYERVWGYDFGATSNALWVYIGYLRRKLEEGGEPRLLHTVRGVGYALARRTVSFRLRLMLFTALAIAVTVTGASIAVWVVAKHELYSQLDQTVNTAGLALQSGRSPASGRYRSSVQPTIRDRRLYGAGRSFCRRRPPSSRSRRRQVRRQLDRQHGERQVPPRLRRSAPAARRGRPGRSARPTMRSGRIDFWTCSSAAMGIALAALAALVATAAFKPVRRLTTAAEKVAATGDLTERVDASTARRAGTAGDPPTRCSRRSRTSVGAQRRLVADASHELRTPLTAADERRTSARRQLPPEKARRALDEASAELGALTQRSSPTSSSSRAARSGKLRVEDVQLDDLVATAVERAKAACAQATFVTSLSPSSCKPTRCCSSARSRTCSTTRSSAAPAGTPIEVRVRGGRGDRPDHGPGGREEDLPRIFDRFYRAATARSKPGAGLGLAIVREAATAHGGTATSRLQRARSPADASSTARSATRPPTFGHPSRRVARRINP